MNKTSEVEELTNKTSRLSGFDVESLLAPNLPNVTATNTNTSPRLTAKVQPFEIKENDPMESNTPRHENNFKKVPLAPNQSLFPNVGYAVPSMVPTPLALANLQLYSLWSQAGMVNPLNWPFLPTPGFAQPIRPVTTQVLPRTTDINTTRTKPQAENPSSDDTSLNSNSATESLFAASECHLAVLRDDDGDTPLHIAIVHENQRLIQKLVGLISFSRLTVNTPNNLSQTPLHLAVLTKQPVVIQQLMNTGGDANVQDRNGQTPVHLAASKGYIACLAEILAARSRNPSLNLEIKNFEGFTALHVAVQKQHKSIVEALIQYGANINAKDGKSGHTPLHHAIDCESCEVLQLLVTKRANVNKPNYSGISPVQSANSCRNEAVSKILLSQETVTTTSPPKFKTSTTFIPVASTPTDFSAANVKNTDNRTEMLKRSRESSPSTSKRARMEVDK